MWSDGYARYNTAISRIFSAENKLKLQLEVEIALAKVQEKLGMIPEGTTDRLESVKDKVALKRVQEIEREIHHDLMAMVKAFAEVAGDAGEFIHNTATSMDIQDTVLAIQLVKAREMLIDEGEKIAQRLEDLALTYKNLPCVGRTHGQFAVPTTVGFKFANFLFEMRTALKRLEEVNINQSKFSGAVGNYASSHRMDLEELVLKELGLEPVLISTQVVSRLFIADYMFALATIASVTERIAKEIRHLQRSEISEWYEPRSSSQVGSSAMPHKRNPHKSERLNGLARIVRANVAVSLENIALEHERDLTNSSPERLVLPSSIVTLHYMLIQLGMLLEGIEIDEDNIKRNLQRASGSKSEQILLLLIDKVGRQSGHELLRRHVGATDFKSSVLADTEITNLVGAKKLEEIFENIDVGLAPEKVDQVIEWSRSVSKEESRR